jgi:hypothetical protein
MLEPRHNLPMIQKNAAAVALGRKGGIRGGPARAAKLTPEQRSESARNAVRARWAKVAPAAPSADASKKALHLCLKRIRAAKDETELRILTEELQKILFRKQYQNAKD